MRGSTGLARVCFLPRRRIKDLFDESDGSDLTRITEVEDNSASIRGPVLEQRRHGDGAEGYLPETLREEPNEGVAKQEGPRIRIEKDLMEEYK